MAEVEALIARGESPDRPDKQGLTPLHLAAQEGALSASSALLEAGASVDAENDFGNTPLFVAVFNSRGRGDLIDLLRSHGANPFHANASGQTPLGLARMIGNYDVAQYFGDLLDPNCCPSQRPKARRVAAGGLKDID